MANIIQGGDYPIIVTLTNSAGVAVDLTTLAGYILVLYDSEGTILQQYSEQTLAGFKTLEETTAASGIFTVRLQSIDTKTAKLGDVFAEVKTATVDGNYTGNRHDVDNLILVGTVVVGQSKNTTAIV